MKAILIIFLLLSTSIYGKELESGQYWKVCTDTDEPACIYSRIIEIKDGNVTYYYSTEPRFKLKLKSTTTVRDYRNRFITPHNSEYDFIDHSYRQDDTETYNIYLNSKYTNVN